MKGSWLSEGLIANPMSIYPEYRQKRQSWYGPMTSAIVEISTDAGIRGLGTVGGGKGKLAAVVVDEQFRTLLIGRNPRGDSLGVEVEGSVVVAFLSVQDADAPVLRGELVDFPPRLLEAEPRRLLELVARERREFFLERTTTRGRREVEARTDEGQEKVEAHVDIEPQAAETGKAFTSWVVRDSRMPTNAERLHDGRTRVGSRRVVSRARLFPGSTESAFGGR